MTDIILPKLDQTGDNEWADVQDNDLAIRGVVNGQLDDGNIRVGAAIAGSKLADNSIPASKLMTGAGALTWYPPVVTGAAAPQETNSTSYTYLATPDKIPNVVVPANGLVLIGYTALWREMLAAAARVRAAIHFANEPSKAYIDGSASPQTVAAAIQNTNPEQTPKETYTRIVTSPIGLMGTRMGATSLAAEVGTGIALGYGTDSSEGATYIYRVGPSDELRIIGHDGVGENNNGIPIGGMQAFKIAAGTYDIGVKFRTTNAASPVSVKERSLYVAVLG